MKRAFTFLLCLALALVVPVWSAQAQSTPAPKPKSQPTTPARRAGGTTHDKAVAPGIIKDTAAFNKKFRRSGRPDDKPLIRPLPERK